jgi:hypothetical protein
MLAFAASDASVRETLTERLGQEVGLDYVRERLRRLDAAHLVSFASRRVPAGAEKSTNSVRLTAAGVEHLCSLQREPLCPEIEWFSLYRCPSCDTAVASPAFTAGDPMPLSDLDINRSAHLWIQQHRDQALAKAREMVETMRRRGDEERADTWLRIIAAITTWIAAERHAALSRLKLSGRVMLSSSPESAQALRPICSTRWRCCLPRKVGG